MKKRNNVKLLDEKWNVILLKDNFIPFEEL